MRGRLTRPRLIRGPTSSGATQSGSGTASSPYNQGAVQPVTHPVKGSKTGGSKTGGIVDSGHKKTPDSLAIGSYPLRGQDLNLRPLACFALRLWTTSLVSWIVIIFFVVAGLPISTGDFANSPILFAVVPTTWILKGATFGSYIFSTGFLLAAISSGFLLTSVKRA